MSETYVSYSKEKDEIQISQLDKNYIVLTKEMPQHILRIIDGGNTSERYYD